MVSFMLSYHTCNIFTFKVVECSTALVLKTSRDDHPVRIGSAMKRIFSRLWRSQKMRSIKSSYNMLIDSLRDQLVRNLSSYSQMMMMSKGCPFITSETEKIHLPDSDPQLEPRNSPLFRLSLQAADVEKSINWLRSSVDSGDMSCLYIYIYTYTYICCFVWVYSPYSPPGLSP